LLQLSGLRAVDNPKVSAGEIYNVADDEQLTLRQWVEIITQVMNYRWEIVNVPKVIARPGWPLLPFQGPTSHRLMDTRKVELELGYKDLVPVRLALERTVQWYIEHQPERGGETESRLQDPFDYTVGDEVINLYS
jgi:nucleoside-diphosphate-sugar epimerase